MPAAPAGYSPSLPHGLGRLVLADDGSKSAFGALKGCATRPSRVFRAYRAGRLRDHEARLFLQPQLASAQFSVKGNLLSLPRKLP